MKKLLITLLLISPFSFADWDDVYYCQMTSYSEVSLEGKRINYILEKFQFKLDEAKNAMVFGKDSYFRNAQIELDSGWLPSMEVWGTSGFRQMSLFDKGKFLFTDLIPTRAATISADCDKF